MRLLSRFLSLFPLLNLTLILAASAGFVVAPSAVMAFAVLFACYGVPLCAFRLIGVWCPLRQGRSLLDEWRYSAWWGGHQIQAIYIALPQLESLLQLVPGLFSLWLRLWGSKVGRCVYWTPRVEIADRSLLEIGDRVVFGHKVEMYAHVVRPKGGHLVLYVRKITIGKDVFVGAGSRIGPGVRIEDGVHLPILTDVFPNRRVLNGKLVPAVSHLMRAVS